MESQLTGRFQVITDPEAVADDQLMGRIALFNAGGDIINPVGAAEGVTQIVVITQSEYDELDPPDPATLYVVQG